MANDYLPAPNCRISVLSEDIGSDAEPGVLERGIVCAGRLYEFQRK